MDEAQLSQIGGNLSKGLSVFYAVLYHCTYSLGYLPQHKYLPEGELSLADELHKERILGSKWLIKDAVTIRDRIVPQVSQVSCELRRLYCEVEKSQMVTEELLKEALQLLEKSVKKIAEESKSLKEWLKKVGILYQEVLSKEKYITDPDSYSWQDAAEKLQLVSEIGGKMDVSWESIVLLVNEAVKELEKAEKSSVEILKKMFTKAAIKQWEDVTEIAKKITDFS